MTKKIIAILATTLISCLSVNPQFSVSGLDNIIGVAQENIDTVLVAETTENLVLKYNVEESSTISWYTYVKDAEELTLVKTEENVTESTLEALPEASIGYAINVNDEKTFWAWVFDHSKHNLEIDNSTKTEVTMPNSLCARGTADNKSFTISRKSRTQLGNTQKVSQRR